MLNDFLQSAPVESAFNWFGSRGIVIIATVFVAWLSYHLVGFVMDYIFRRVIRRSKFSTATDIDIKKRQKTLATLSATIFRVAIVICTVFVVIKELWPGINYAPLFASAGIVGIALGFGAQSLIKDFLTGMFIISENQYRVGDVVEIQGAAGTVERVGIRSTVIRDVNGNVHYLPNGIIDHVINKTMGFSKIHLTLSVQPDTDVDKLTTTVNAVGTKLAEDAKWESRITEPPKFVNITNFTHYSMDFVITGTTLPSEQWAVSGELRRRLMTAFRKHHIELAVTPVMSFGSEKTKGK